MVAQFEHGYAVLQSGFWNVECDTLHPRLTSLRADAQGVGNYCQEMTTPALGGLTVCELEPNRYIKDEQTGQLCSESKKTIFTSQQSTTHKAFANIQEKMKLQINNIAIGDFATVNWELYAVKLISGSFLLWQQPFSPLFCALCIHF